MNICDLPICCHCDCFLFQHPGQVDGQDDRGEMQGEDCASPTRLSNTQRAEATHTDTHTPVPTDMHAEAHTETHTARRRVPQTDGRHDSSSDDDDDDDDDNDDDDQNDEENEDGGDEEEVSD